MAMTSLSIDQYDRPNYQNHIFIQPGNVGSVGDVNVSPHFQASYPDAPVLLDPYFSGANASRLGSSVQNGTSVSYVSGGSFARTIDTNWMRRRNRTRVGWIMQDLRGSDKVHEPVMGQTPQYGWNNKVATVVQSLRRGEQFSPLPMGYNPGFGLPRGGQVPQITVIGGDGNTNGLKSVVTGNKAVMDNIAKTNLAEKGYVVSNTDANNQIGGSRLY